MNLENEAINSYKLTEIFKNIPNVNIIKIYQSTKNYHVSKKIVGLDIDLLLVMYPMFNKKIIYILHLSYLLMLIRNCFHCDWHFGNFLVKINSNNDLDLHILDTGLV